MPCTGTILALSFTGLIACLAMCAARHAVKNPGTLRVHADNPRYFTDGRGRAIYLTGSHVWGNLQDYGYGPGYVDPPPVFDYHAYLDMMQRYRHNFIRMWCWEAPHAQGPPGQEDTYWASPMVYERTGPGQANDGKPKFDLTRFNQAYFDRLRSRVIAAGERGIYVSVMLFQGWSVWNFDHIPGRKVWPYHPFQKGNNINGIDGDPNGTGEGGEAHALRIPGITQLQETYVRKVIDTVNDLDNVLFEISNETIPKELADLDTKAWEYHMVRYIKEYEGSQPKQHPVGVTSNSQWQSPVLDTSPSDWVSLRQKDWRDMTYVDNPPAADGRKVSILDTDHLGAERFIGDAACARRWVWKALLRGHHPILMDSFGIDDRTWDPNGTGFVAARQAMGHTRQYAQRMNLAAMTPHNDLASSRYCLANPGREYLIYLPEGGEVTVDLSAASGPVVVEWFNCRSGVPRDDGAVASGAERSLRVPFDGDAALYLKVQAET